MIKTFKEMMAVDITKYLDERDKIKYLPWGACKQLLHENGAEVVYFEPLVDERTGSTLFMADQVFGAADKTHRCYEVRVKIVIDDLSFVQNYPLINGTNPVKDNSISSLRMHTAQARAFVKGVAIRTGLGFSLWLNDPDDDKTEDLSRHSIFSIRKRVEELMTVKLQHMSQAEMLKRMGINERQLGALLKYYGQLAEFEKKLSQI